MQIYTDEEFSELIRESMDRQSRPVTMLDPRRRRCSLSVADHGLYVGLFQVKDDSCLCSCEADRALGRPQTASGEPEHCGHCVPVERGLHVSYEPSSAELEQARGLSSPA